MNNVEFDERVNKKEVPNFLNGDIIKIKRHLVIDEWEYYVLVVSLPKSRDTFGSYHFVNIRNGRIFNEKFYEYKPTSVFFTKDYICEFLFDCLEKSGFDWEYIGSCDIVLKKK